ncbi:MAG: hypothetical protein ACRDYX_04580 [Egibacteraceae bacterium]
MTVQDDARELELLRLFNLTVPPERKRGEIDATLELGDLLVPFELKSTTGSYTLFDARLVQKNQYSAARYRDLMDLPEGYSRERMLEIIRERCRYLLKRGSTLNNPHLPGSYFEGWERITNDHASRLRQLVRRRLAYERRCPPASACATEHATA